MALSMTIGACSTYIYTSHHDDVIKWRHFPRYWPFVRGIHRSPLNSQHKGQWRGVWCFLRSASEYTVEWGWWFETPSPPLWRHRNDSLQDGAGQLEATVSHTATILGLCSSLRLLSFIHPLLSHEVIIWKLVKWGINATVDIFCN